MKPLIVLLVVFLIALGSTKLVSDHANISLSGRIAMSIMLLFTTIGHFKFSKGMKLMMPGFIPYRTAMVYFTGFLEIFAAIGLLMPSPWSKGTAWFLIVFFIILLPANIYSAVRRVDYEKATYNGPGPAYLWFRIPLQLFFIGWVYFFAIKLNAPIS